MYQVIARKYRPQTFHDVVNQEHVKTTLENAIAQKRIAHGYIFSGQRGTGKTTVARILARCLNCIQGPTATPCGVCASCLEITAGGAWTSSKSTPPPTAASTKCANCARTSAISRRATATRSSSSTKPTRSPTKPSTRSSRPSRSRRVGGLRALHHGSAQDSGHHRFPLPALQLPLGGFRRPHPRAWRGSASRKASRPIPKRWPCWPQAGEGSVRDSLSALDQAIACCGVEARRRRSARAAGRILARIAGTGVASAGRNDSRRMLEVVDELERNGHNLQHFSRELARYFRNLLVAAHFRRGAAPGGRIRRSSARSWPRSPRNSPKRTSRRYLQLSLDLFRDLQFSLAAALPPGNRPRPPGASRPPAAHRRSAGAVRWGSRNGPRPGSATRPEGSSPGATTAAHRPLALRSRPRQERPPPPPPAIPASACTPICTRRVSRTWPTPSKTPASPSPAPI
jgi:DNA polymerase-3 subunit gamma/tau